MTDTPTTDHDGFFYVEWTGKDCPFCGLAGVSGKAPGGQFFAGCPDADCLGFHLAYDFVTVDHAQAAWDKRASASSELGSRLLAGTLSVTSFEGHCVRIEFDTREEADEFADLLAEKIT